MCHENDVTRRVLIWWKSNYGPSWIVFVILENPDNAKSESSRLVCIAWRVVTSVIITWAHRSLIYQLIGGFSHTWRQVWSWNKLVEHCVEICFCFYLLSHLRLEIDRVTFWFCLTFILDIMTIGIKSYYSLLQLYKLAVASCFLLFWFPPHFPEWMWLVLPDSVQLKNDHWRVQFRFQQSSCFGNSWLPWFSCVLHTAELIYFLSCETSLFLSYSLEK